ncbi:hypothetical protein BH24ACT5_BH24ACT5_03920 [soil metagenome]
MTIKRGAPWGRPAPATDVTNPHVVVTTDAGVAAAVTSGDAPAVVVRGGDLWRAVGSPEGPVSRELPIDVLRITADGVDVTAVAHIVAWRTGRLGPWRGPVVGAFNVDHVGPFDVAPEAHPNDGRFDVVEVASGMSWRARWQARRRLPSGTHVPHPDISTRRVRHAEFSFEQPMAVRIDGVAVGPLTSCSVTIDPDAAVVLV